MDKEIILKVSDLMVSYGGIKAVKEISFEVHKSEIVTLIGANGAGKTSLLHAISGIVPYKGLIEFGGLRLSNIPAHKIVSLGIAHVPEGRGIFGNLTVMENLKLATWQRRDKKGFLLTDMKTDGLKDKISPEKLEKINFLINQLPLDLIMLLKQLKEYKFTQKEIDEVLKCSEVEGVLDHDYDYVFGLFPRLKERINQQAGTLSGGEQQMLALGRALMSNGKMLLLDEPSMGLSPVLVQEIFTLLREINKKGTTILLVEQNANMALKLADRGYVLETGSITLSGKGKDLLENPLVREAYLGA